MYLGKVVGTVVSTTKNEALVGFKLLDLAKDEAQRLNIKLLKE